MRLITLDDFCSVPPPIIHLELGSPMSKRSKSRQNSKPKDPSSGSGGNAAELPRTPFWQWALMIALLVGIVGGIADTTSGVFGIMDRLGGLWESLIPTPMPFPEEAPGESLIVVAQFDRAVGIPDSRSYEKIADAIRSAVGSLNINNVRVETLPDVIPSRASDKAEDIGKLFNATTVIWGEETSVDVRVNLLNRRQVWVTNSVRSGADGLETSSTLNYVQPGNTEEMLARFNSPLSGIPNYPALPLIYSPLPIASGNITVSTTDGTYVTTYADPQQYIKLITTDLPREMTFFALLPVAQIQAFDGNEQIALNLLEKALDAKPDALSNRDDTAKIYREVARLHLSLARDLMVNTGVEEQNALVEHGQTAKERLNQALEAGLTEPLTYYFLGMAYYLTNENAEALHAFDAAMELEPDDRLQIFVLFERAYVKSELGDNESALADITSLLRLDAEVAGAYHVRAKIRFQMGDYRGTIADVDKAVEIHGSATKIPDIVDLKAQAYIALKEYDKAVDTMQKLVDVVGPENREYAELRLQETKALAGR